MKVAGYIRVSTQAQAQEGESLKTQKKQISDFINSKEGWELVKIYSDKGRSGSTVEGRPAFNQMMASAEEVEGRRLAKGNSYQQTRYRTQRREDLQHELGRIRQAAQG
jgi:DNA invertase Pin-like site-specific DNA recombinase